jgi:hypothetical protein
MPAPTVTYLRRWLVSTCAIVLAAVAINLVVDPYGIYRLANMDGINGFKSRAAQRGSLFKVKVLEHFRPAAIILGNSRAEVGFDPAHGAFARAGGPAVNLALPGSGIGTSVQFLKRAIAMHPPRIAVVGLDFLDARTSGDPQRAQIEYRELSRQSTASVPEWWRGAAEHVDALASVDALYDSLITLRDNRRQDSPGLTALGFNPMRDYAALARNQGYYQLFLQRDLENARAYLRGPRQVFVRGSRTAPYFEAVRALARSCRDAGVELHLLVYPYHAHILELFHAAGLWEPFEEWKRALVTVLREEAAADGGAEPFPLWDFSGYGAFASERVPPDMDRTAQMHWYWEAGHFKKELGDVMLDRMLDQPSDRQAAGDAFGVLLTGETIERHLSRIRAGREPYRHSRAQELSELDALVRSVARSRAH